MMYLSHILVLKLRWRKYLVIIDLKFLHMSNYHCYLNHEHFSQANWRCKSFALLLFFEFTHNLRFMILPVFWSFSANYDKSLNDNVKDFSLSFQKYTKKKIIRQGLMFHYYERHIYFPSFFFFFYFKNDFHINLQLRHYTEIRKYWFQYRAKIWSIRVVTNLKK